MNTHLEKEKLAIAIWDTDKRKLIAVCDSIQTTTLYLIGNNGFRSLSTIRYAVAAKGIIPAKKNILGLNLKIKPANIEQVKLIVKPLTIL